MRWQSLIPNVPRGTRVLLAVLIGTFVLVEIALGWLELPIAPYIAIAPGALTPTNLVALPLHILYNPSPNGLSFVFTLYILAWMLGALDERFGPKRVYQLTALVAIGAGLAAFLVGWLVVLAGGRPLPVVGSGPLVIAAAALGAYLVRHAPEIYLFATVRVTPAQLFGLILGITVLDLLITRSFVHFAEDMAAFGIGILFGRHLEGGPQGARRASRPSATKLRVVKGGGDRTLH